MKTDIEILEEITGNPNTVKYMDDVTCSEALNAMATLRSQMQEKIDELKPYLRHKDDCMTEKVDSSMAEHYEVYCTCKLNDKLK